LLGLIGLGFPQVEKLLALVHLALVLVLLLLVLRIDRLEIIIIRFGLACLGEFHNVKVTLRELLGIGGGVPVEKAIDPLTPSEVKVGLLALGHDAHGVHHLDLLLALLLLVNGVGVAHLCRLVKVGGFVSPGAFLPFWIKPILAFLTVKNHTVRKAKMGLIQNSRNAPGETKSTNHRPSA
jgi:hypothetical protein